AAAGTGVPVVNSERSDNYEITATQRIGHRLTKALVDGVVANSRSGAAFAQRLYGYDPERMHVVWNGLRIAEVERAAASDLDYRELFFGPGRPKLAVLVGSIKPAKDYPLAIDTAAALVGLGPEWRVLFIGDQLAKSVNY